MKQMATSVINNMQPCGLEDIKIVTQQATLVTLYPPDP